MAFTDRTRIRVEAGSGGDGAVSFRREKYTPKGGPDGGDGGAGGDVILHATHDVQDFSHIAGRHLFKAENGQNGAGGNRHGRDGRDLVIKVPPGTIVSDAETGEVLKDLDGDDMRFTAAAGGRGGRGNRRFATSTNQVPRTAEEGRPGQSRLLDLELKMIADVGLVGLPNAGKSTLLSRISRARPKVAAYPFTTLHPNLGVLELDRFTRLVAADIPGIIRDAHKGVGLGDEFLRHIERTRVLAHVIDASGVDPVADYRTLRAELTAYGFGLDRKRSIVVANKTDLAGAEAGVSALREAVEEPVVPVSSLTGEGLETLMEVLTSLAEGSAGSPKSKL